MRAGPFFVLVGRDLRRSARSFIVASMGIAVGIATLAFFIALGSGLRDVVLGKIFPVDRLEVVQREEAAGALVAMFARAPTGISQETVDRLRGSAGVRAVFPKMKLLFPSSGRGGRAILGRDVGTGELVADGIEPSLVAGDLPRGARFEDNAATASSASACRSHAECSGEERCDTDIASDGASVYPGRCERMIPALVSPYLVEVFNGAIAPAHGLPRLGDLLVRQAQGMELEWDLGRAGLGGARQGTPRRVHVQVIGISPRAIDLGITVPIATARRLNREYNGEGAATRYTGLTVVLAHPSDTARVSAAIRAMGLEVKTSGAEQMGLLVALITAVLSLTSVIVVVLAALNIAHAFGALVRERRGEIGLLRSLGATRGDVRRLILAQAAALGIVSSIAGLALARAAAYAWNRASATRLPPFPFKPDDWFLWEWNALAMVTAFGVVACVVSALAPAQRAARVEPAQALAGGV